MKVTTDHTYIVSDKHIDDSLFTILLECTYQTGNRLIYCREQEDVFSAFNKYKKEGENNYYIIYAN